ncbi:MAG: hypothetical protein COA32_09710 [Fluviicola sp.]|nr:MAG: hypothetical protein COA32_09710 [Fluviicola sp.]
MNVLIAYDINVERHGELKEELLDSGFFNAWTDSDNVKHDLPNTTLWIPNMIDVAQARSIYKAAVETVNRGGNPDDTIETTKFVAVNAVSFLGAPSNNNS